MTTTLVAGNRVSVVKWPVLGLLLYWFLYALLAPVTIYDAHVYNIARLLLIRQGGFFGNHVWNISPEISYPWGFDAVHYPFVWLGAGFDLPSFACLAGVLMVIHQLVSRHYGVLAAWWCDLAVVAMPTVVYQATSTKNDLAGVFAVAVWFYSLYRWNEGHRRIYLAWMALALAFNAGTKFSGPPVAALLSLYTFWRIRGLPRRQILEFCGALGVFFLFFGSAETYLNNYLLFKHPLGPPEYIRFHRNIDGLAGGVANFIRYFFGAMNIGVDACNPQSPVAGWLGTAGRGTLHFLGLDNVGYRRDYNDDGFVVLKTGLEAAADYGPAGALALLTAIYLVIVRLPGDPLWKISAGGLAALGQTCLTVGWMPWNNRFLLLPFILFGVAFTLYSLRPGPRVHVRQIFLWVLFLFSAVVYPLHSYNRKPADLLSALTNREALSISERPTMGGIVADLEARARADHATPLLLNAGEDSWTYDVLKIKNLHVLPTPNLNQQTLAAIAARTGASRLLVLTLNRVLDPALASELKALNSYAESNTFLYEWQRADLRRAGEDEKLVTRFAEGWYAEEKSPVGAFRWMSATANLDVATEHAGTLIIHVQLRSIVPGNGVDLFVDNQPVTSVLLHGTEWEECLLRVPLPSGDHQISFHGRQPALQPPGDSRQLDICAENFRARLDP